MGVILGRDCFFIAPGRPIGLPGVVLGELS